MHFDALALTCPRLSAMEKERRLGERRPILPWSPEGEVEGRAILP